MAGLNRVFKRFAEATIEERWGHVEKVVVFIEVVLQSSNMGGWGSR